MARFIPGDGSVRLGRAWAGNGGSSYGPSVYKYRQVDGSSIYTSRIAIVRLVRPTTVDGSSRRMIRLLAHFYTDGLSDELLFFARARPRRIIRLQYKSGQCFFQEIIFSGSEYGKCNIVTNSLAFVNSFYFIGSFVWPQSLTTRNKCNLTCVCFHES